MHFQQPLRLALPHPGVDHPATQSLVAHLDLVQLGQLLAGERRTEVVPFRLLQNGQCLSPRCFRQLTVGGFPPQSMHHHQIAFAFHAPQQLPDPPLAHAHPFCGLPLRDHPVHASTSPTSLVPPDSSRFVPSLSLTAVKRNFLLWPNRNFSLWRDITQASEPASWPRRDTLLISQTP